MDGYDENVKQRATSLVIGTASRSEMNALASAKHCGVVDVESLNLEEELSDFVIDLFLSTMPIAIFPHAAHISPSITANARRYPDVLRDAIQDTNDMRRRFLCFPTNIRGNHWVLMYFDRYNNELKCLDPLAKKSDATVKRMGEAIRDLICNVYGLSNVPVQYVNDVPKQQTTLGCGPMMLGYMLAVVQKINFSRTTLWLNDQSMRLYVACVFISGQHKSGRTGGRSRSSRPDWWDDVEGEVPAEVFMLEPYEMKAVNKRATRTHPWRIDHLVTDQQLYIQEGPSQGASYQTALQRANACADFIMMAPSQSEEVFHYGPISSRYGDFSAGVLASALEGTTFGGGRKNVGVLPDSRALANFLNRFGNLPHAAPFHNKIQSNIVRINHCKAAIQHFIDNLVPQDMVTSKQFFKLLYFGALFWRRWTGPWSAVPRTQGATLQHVTDQTLSAHIRPQHRFIVDGRADGASSAIYAQLVALRNKLTPAGRANFDKLPMLMNTHHYLANAQFFPAEVIDLTGAHSVGGVQITLLWKFLTQGVAQQQACIRIASAPTIYTAIYMTAMLSSTSQVWQPPPWLDLRALVLDGIA